MWLIQTKRVSNKTLATFPALLLTMSNIIFNSKFYLQIKWSTMGTICALVYANISVAYFENNIHIYPLIEAKMILYLCFIDITISFHSKYSRQ